MHPDLRDGANLESIFKDHIFDGVINFFRAQGSWRISRTGGSLLQPRESAHQRYHGRAA